LAKKWYLETVVESGNRVPALMGTKPGAFFRDSTGPFFRSRLNPGRGGRSFARI